MRYTLSDFNKVLENGIPNQISDDTIKIINMLADKVGAPEYVKTPQFKIKQNVVSGRRRKKYQEVNDDDWDTMRAFQTTEFEKKEGIEFHLYEIRKFLNKLSENTFQIVKDNIILEIKTVMVKKTENDLLYLYNEIYNIVSKNMLYSDIYSKLYKNLINEDVAFHNILFKNFDKFEEAFHNIEYYDPEKNYDKFCENNKKNEELRSISTFYVNLMKEGIIEKFKIGNIITNIFIILDDMIANNNKKNEIDELSEIIYILITNSYECIRAENNELGKAIYTNVERITNIKSKEMPGITNKCIFKHMDILDEIGN